MRNRKGLPVDGWLNRTSVTDWLVRLSEGQRVLQGAFGHCAAVSVLSGAGATGSEHPQGVSFRQGVRGVRKDTCKDRVCAPDAFSFFSPTQGSYRLPLHPLWMGTGFLCVHKNPVVVSEMQYRVYAPVLALYRGKARVSTICWVGAPCCRNIQEKIREPVERPLQHPE